MHAFYLKLKLRWRDRVSLLAAKILFNFLDKTVFRGSPRRTPSPGRWLLIRLLRFDYFKGGLLSDGLLKSNALPFGSVAILISSVPEPTFLLFDASLLIVYAIYSFGVLVVNVYQGRGLFDTLAFLDIFD